MYATDKSVTSKLLDWVKIGARVRVKDRVTTATVYGVSPANPKAVYVIYDGGGGGYVTSDSCEPITRWVPERGERVACWDNDMSRVAIREYATLKYANTVYLSPQKFHHIARIPENWAAEGYPLSVEWWSGQEQYEED